LPLTKLSFVLIWCENGLDFWDHHSCIVDRQRTAELVKLYEPVGELYATYQKAIADYEAYMASWRGKLPDSDLSGRALELALTEIERSLR
jgi:hypothetical protein